MSSLTLVVTDAGRAALVNAQNTGTLPVLLARVGVTATAFAASKTTAALPGELKRLVTFAGAAVAADTLHVTIRDDSADTYSLRGFALYLEDGTLFASYGQADPIGEKSAQSMLLLAVDVIFTDIDATALTFGDTDFLLASATTEQEGIVRLATDAEATAGVDAQRAVVPKGLKAALDARFGAGAPSTFVKSTLTAATAAAFRVLLALKGAALLDTGHGNDLDADLLDGQHGSYYRAWANLTGVPTVFPPAAHQHAWIDITGVPATATRWPAWDEVTGKPATFTPAAHSHAWANINDPPATATRWPAWSEVTSKPAFGSASLYDAGAFASAAQGVRADAAMPKAGGGFTGGINFGSGGAASPTDFSQYISLYANTNGIGISGGQQNYCVGAANSHVFYVNGVEIGRFSNNGLATNFPSFAGTCSISIGNADAASLAQYNTKFQVWWGLGFCDFTGTVRATLDARAGSWILQGTVTASGFTSSASSRTVKHAIAPCRYGLAEFLQIPWVEYRYDAAITDDDRLRFGAIVEDVEPVAPELVIRRKDQVPTFEYDQFIPVIGRALQQYIAANDARVARAEARTDGLARALTEAVDRIALLEGAR